MRTNILTLAFAGMMLAAPAALAAPASPASPASPAALAAPAAPAVKETPAVPEMLANQADQIFLRESVMVSGKLIRLGDLFANAGETADVPVAYSPKPGKRATFDSNWLYRVAQGYKLKWRPLSIHVKAVVERDSIVIKREEIEDHILAALIDKDVGVDGDMSVEVNNRMLRLYVAGDSDATLYVEDVEFEPRTNRFTAIVTAPVNDPAAPRTRVTGRVFKVSEVPVLNRRMLSGEIISARDIEWIKLRSKRLQNDAILTAEDLIGKAPRRSMRAGAPIRSSEVRRPVLVPRGGLVTIVLRMPDMILTAQGKALDEGSDGDTIRVTNTQSNTVIEAVVSGASIVSVRPTNRVAMN